MNRRLGPGLIGGDAAEEQVVLQARRRADPGRVVELDRRLKARRQHLGEIGAGGEKPAPHALVDRARAGAGFRCSAAPARSAAPDPGRFGAAATGARSCARPDPRNRSGRRRRRTRSARRADGRPEFRRRSRSCWWRWTRPSRSSGLVRSSASRIARMNGCEARLSSWNVSPIGRPNRMFSPIVAWWL